MHYAIILNYPLSTMPTNQVACPEVFSKIDQLLHTL